MSRISAFLSLVLLCFSVAVAKEKSKAVLPADVLTAQTVLVVISPEAGDSVTDPNANRIAQEDVEKSLMKWGRFRLALEPGTADLVIAVRKGSGRLASPTIGKLPDNRPVILEPTDNGNVRIGGQHGRTPDLSQPTPGRPDNGPAVRTDVGPSEDAFEVYRGGIKYPLDNAPVWRYFAKDALRPPTVSAVEQFKKAIEAAEKAATRNQPKQNP